MLALVGKALAVMYGVCQAGPRADFTFSIPPTRWADYISCTELCCCRQEAICCSGGVCTPSLCTQPAWMSVCVNVISVSESMHYDTVLAAGEAFMFKHACLKVKDLWLQHMLCLICMSCVTQTGTMLMTAGLCVPP